MPTTSAERFAVLETEMKHVRETVDEIRAVQKTIHAAMLETQGAFRLGRWLMPAATGVIGFVASKLGTVHITP